MLYFVDAVGNYMCMDMAVLLTFFLKLYQHTRIHPQVNETVI